MLRSVELGIEEYSFALGLAGYPEAAKVLLVASFGQLTAEDEHGRLLSAGHSLMARKLLFLEEGVPTLAGEFRALLVALTEYDFAISFMRKSETVADTILYTVCAGGIVEQRLEQGVICQIQTLSDIPAIALAGIQFFGISLHTDDLRAEAALPRAVLSRALDTVAQAPDRTLGTLLEAGLPEPLATALAGSFTQMESRGLVTRLDNTDGRVALTQEILFLRGNGRAWLFPALSGADKEHVRVMPGTPAAFGQLVVGLCTASAATAPD